MSDDLVNIFIEEANELMVSVHEALEQLTVENKEKYLKEVKRYLHTMKGGAKMVGQESIANQVHDLETCVTELVENVSHDSEEVRSSVALKVDDINDQINRLKIGPEKESPSHEEGDQDLYLSISENIDHVNELYAVWKQKQNKKNLDLLKEAYQTLQKNIALTQKEELLVLIQKGKNLLEGWESPKKTKTVISLAVWEELQASLADCATALMEGKDLPYLDSETGIRESHVGLLNKQVKINAGLLNNFNKLAIVVNISRSHVETDVQEVHKKLSDSLESQYPLRHIVESIPHLMSDLEATQEKKEHFQKIRREILDCIHQVVDTHATLFANIKSVKETLYTTENLLLEQGRAAVDLHVGLTEAQMLSFRDMVPRLQAMVDKVARQLGKKILLLPEKVDQEIDRYLLEGLLFPLEHMLRNAVDHGIESLEVRKKNKKPEEGKICINVQRDGPNIQISIKDDGHGIDVSQVREKAIESGLMDSKSQLSDQEIFRFILKSGFSTKKEVTQISGRGVGLDVVASEVEKMGGTITIYSEVGKGTDFVISIPFTQALNETLVFILSDRWYGLPLHSIHGIVRIPYADLKELLDGKAPFQYHGYEYVFKYLGDLLHQEKMPSEQHRLRTMPVILMKIAETYLAVLVDRLFGTQQLILKTAGAQLKSVREIAGASIMPDGKIVLMLDPIVLEQAVLHERQTGQEHAANGPIIMVVDDSITIRKSLQSMLLPQGYRVITAKDGMDALSVMQEKVPDLVLLDIDMPRMNGYELTQCIRRLASVKHIPVLVISSRTGDEHQDKARAAGANLVLGKPIQERSLLGYVALLLEEPEHGRSTSKAR